MSDEDSDRTPVPLTEAEVSRILRSEIGMEPESLPEWIRIDGRLYKRMVRFSPEYQDVMGVHEVFDRGAEDVELSSDGPGPNDAG